VPSSAMGQFGRPSATPKTPTLPVITMSNPTAPLPSVVRSSIYPWAIVLMLLPIVVFFLGWAASRQEHGQVLGWLSIIMAICCWPLGLILGLVADIRTRRMRNLANILSGVKPQDSRFHLYMYSVLCIPAPFALSPFLALPGLALLRMGLPSAIPLLQYTAWAAVWAVGLRWAWLADQAAPGCEGKPARGVWVVGAVMVLLCLWWTAG
jgi:hypothetical protein